ncbi:hypothetical protein BH11PLA2_BH11PLA2_16630 [soil metagenome]
MSLADDLKKLDQMHLSGSLTDDEFRLAKERLLYGDGQTPSAPDSPPHPDSFSLRHVARSRMDSWFGGVCGGLGERGPLPAWAWRCLFAVSLLVYGVGLIPYILLWILIPTEPSVETAES